MSTLDQPLLIANVNYHVGHWVAIYVAEEQGFFKQEGLTRYEYERSGLLPGPFRKPNPRTRDQGTRRGHRHRGGHRIGDHPAGARRRCLHRRRLALHAVSQMVRLQTHHRHEQTPRRQDRRAGKFRGRRRPRRIFYRGGVEGSRRQPGDRSGNGPRPGVRLPQQPGPHRYAPLRKSKRHHIVAAFLR